MKMQYLARVLTVLSLGLLCNVAWAETYTPVRQTSIPTDGYYIIHSESSSGAGWIHYDTNAAEGKKFRVDTDIDLSSGVTSDQMRYVWKLVNDEEQKTFTLLNMEGDVYIPADEARNQNMKGSTVPANLALTAVEQDGVEVEGKWFIAQTNHKNGENTLFIHTNRPSGYPCLSYWDNYNLGGTSIVVQFYKVEYVKEGEQTESLATVAAQKTALAHVDAHANKLGEGVGYACYVVGGTKVADAEAVKNAINNATTAEEINAIKDSYKFNIPTMGAPYYLYDEAHDVYLDIHNLSYESNYPEVNQMATLSQEVRALYITGDETDGTWKIHTAPSGGSYLCQYTGGKQTWDSWVSADEAAADYNWEVEVSADGEDLCYLLKNTGSSGGYLGCGEHSNGKVLYANQTSDADKLKLKLIEAPANILTISNLDAKGVTYPYALDKSKNELVFDLENLTIAMDVTMPTSLAANTRCALVCAADSTKAVTGATKTNSPYIAYGLYGSNPSYLASSAGGDRFTYSDFAFIGNTNYKVVYVIDRTNKKFSIYVDGALKSTADYPVNGYELQSFSNFATNANAKLYIGGGIVNNTTEYDKFAGIVHSVQFFNAALNEEQIVAIEYPITDRQQDVIDRTHTAYRPTTRATTLESGKRYMIYNTSFDGNEDRTGFMFDNGSGMGHSGVPKKKPATFTTTDEAYLWEIETTDEEGKFYLKAADGGYANATGKTDNATAQVLYIQPWNTSTATKAGVKSEGEDGTVIENANIGGNVFTIGGTKEGNTGKDCWNGNPNTFSSWESAHPFAFYEVEETSVLRPEGSPIPGHTYYIYCANDTRQYFYNEGGTLKVSEKRVEWSNEYLFTCLFDGQYFQFKNIKGKYLKHKGLQDAPYNFELATYLDGVNLKTPGGSYFVMKADGSFDQSTSGEYNPATTDFSTVYKFEEFSYLKDGEVYYIYSDTYKDGGYVNRYMYVDGDELKLNTSLTHDKAYVWTCVITPDGHVQFRNGAGKYLKHRGVQDSPYDFTVNKFNSTHAIAATLYSNADGGRYFAVKNDGLAFDQSTSTSNQTTGDWCTDFVFEPCLDTKKALKLLIDETQTLVSSCYNYYHTAAELTATEGSNYYVSSNADHNAYNENKDGDGIVALMDGSVDTYFHSNWSSNVTAITEAHRLDINLGSGNEVSLFKFAYNTRKTETDFPKTIEVYGKVGDDYEKIGSVTDLPVGSKTESKRYESPAMGNEEKSYSALRFVVTETNSNKTADGKVFFHMAEFDLMPRQAEPVSNYPNSILVPSILTAAEEEVSTAEASIDGIRSMDEYEALFASLQTAYNELTAAIASGNLPVFLSTNADKPYVYKIGIKRGDTKVLQFDYAGTPQMVAVADYSEGNMNQSWYFTKGSADGKVFIHPYLAGGDVLSAKSTNNSPASVWAAPKGTETHQEWTIPVVNKENGTYNIKAGDGSNYFSNNGGVSKKMGFWSNENTTDGGSLFTFTRVEYDGGIWKNCLEAYVNTFCTRESYSDGNTLGYYQGGSVYNAVRAEAVALLADEAATESSLKETYFTLRNANNEVVLIAPEAGKFYTIANNGNYITGSLSNGKIALSATNDANAIFYFDGSHLLSYSTGLYIGLNSSDWGFENVGTAANNISIVTFSESTVNAGEFSINCGGRWLHNSDNAYVNRCSNNTCGAAHSWKVEEVTALPVSVNPNVRFASFYAPVPLILPEGMVAYVVTSTEDDRALLDVIANENEAIPANTGVLLQSEGGSYTLAIAEAAEVNMAEGNMLHGTIDDQYIEYGNNTHYMLGYKNQVAGLYKVSKNLTSAGKEDEASGTHFKNNGFKSYLTIPGSINAAALHFSRGGTTDFDNEQFTIDNSQLIIYDLMGRKVNTMEKGGMYIVNGKKVVIR